MPIARASRIALPLAILLLLPAGCARKAVVPTAGVWIMGGKQPAFDPDGPPDSKRWALERLLTRGLLERDSTGRVIPAVAERFEISPDSLHYTFHISPRLTFVDGSPCRSSDFRRALEGGLGRKDHSTRAWLLATVQGVSEVRAGRTLPSLGIVTPDDTTLVLNLTRPDPLLLGKLAVPGVADAWTQRGVRSWSESRGLGPYKVVESDPARRLRLVRVAGPGSSWSEPDTLTLRFGVSTARVRSLLRAGIPDLVWPLPLAILDEAVPPGYRSVVRDALPERRLLLIQRADLPPTSRPPTRHALAHGINRGDLVRELGPLGRELSRWPSGADRFEFPQLDPGEIVRWMEQGKLGRSFHVVMAYDADGPAGKVARGLQGEWSRHAIYVELMPLQGEALTSELLNGRAHLLLVDTQSALDDPGADLATLVMPLRGPAVGKFRTGWRTRELDSWLGSQGNDSLSTVADVQRRLEEELIALPLARLPWVWIEREAGPGASFHPQIGPRSPAGPVEQRPAN